MYGLSYVGQTEPEGGWARDDSTGGLPTLVDAAETVNSEQKMFKDLGKSVSLRKELLEDRHKAGPDLRTTNSPKATHSEIVGLVQAEIEQDVVQGDMSNDQDLSMNYQQSQESSPGQIDKLQDVQQVAKGNRLTDVKGIEKQKQEDFKGGKGNRSDDQSSGLDRDQGNSTLPIPQSNLVSENELQLVAELQHLEMQTAKNEKATPSHCLL